MSTRPVAIGLPRGVRVDFGSHQRHRPRQRQVSFQAHTNSGSQKTPRRSLLRGAVLSTLLLLTGVQAFFIQQLRTDQIRGAKERETMKTKLVEVEKTKVTAQDQLSQLIPKMQEANLWVSVELSTGKKAIGSAFGVEDVKGTIWGVSNYHVLQRLLQPSKIPPTATLSFNDGKEFEITPDDIRAASADNLADLVLFRLPKELQDRMREEGRLIPLADTSEGSSQKRLIGQLVTSMGNPYGSEHAGSLGMVGGLVKNGEHRRGGTLYTMGDLIQSDVSVFPGNSGGFLVNLTTGKVEAINTTIRAPGLSWSIPVGVLKSFALAHDVDLRTDGEMKEGVIDGDRFKRREAETKHRQAFFAHVVRTEIQEEEDFLFGDVSPVNPTKLAKQLDGAFKTVLAQEKVDLTQYKNPIQELPKDVYNRLSAEIQKLVDKAESTATHIHHAQSQPGVFSF